MGPEKFTEFRAGKVEAALEGRETSQPTQAPVGLPGDVANPSGPSVSDLWEVDAKMPSIPAGGAGAPRSLLVESPTSTAPRRVEDIYRSGK